MKGRYSDEQWKEITSANCVQVAEALGLEFDEKRSDQKALHVKGYGGLYVWRNGRSWYQHSSGEKGFAVDLVQKIAGLNYRESLDFIADNVLITSDFKHTYTPPPPSTKKAEKKEFVLPPKADNENRVFAYLAKSRCIDPMIVRYALKQKLIYQEQKYGNCCFVGFDKNGIAKYCTKRGTNSNVQFRGEVAGSDKSIAWKINGAGEDPRLFVFEAPIDALSHASIYLWTGLDWKKDTRLALGGCSLLALKTELSEHNYRTIVVCSDNDSAGNEVFQKVKDTYGGQYKVLRKSSIGKDWNEDIQNINTLNNLGAFMSTSKKEQVDRYYEMSIDQIKQLIDRENSTENEASEIEIV